jgi:hypothetical protein
MKKYLLLIFAGLSLGLLMGWSDPKIKKRRLRRNVDEFRPEDIASYNKRLIGYPNLIKRWCEIANQRFSFSKNRGEAIRYANRRLKREEREGKIVASKAPLTPPNPPSLPPEKPSKDPGYTIEPEEKD